MKLIQQFTFKWSIAQTYFITNLFWKMYYCFVKRYLENKMATSAIKIQSFIRILLLLKSYIVFIRQWVIQHLKPTLPYHNANAIYIFQCQLESSGTIFHHKILYPLPSLHKQLRSLHTYLRHLPKPGKRLLLNESFVAIPSLHFKARINLFLLTPKSCSTFCGLCLDWLYHTTSILPQSLCTRSRPKQKQNPKTQSPEWKC